MSRITLSAAWAARRFVFEALAHALPREAIGIAVNSQVTRSQDQLHLHVDRLDRDVLKALAEYRDSIDTTWRVMTVALKGRRYWVRRLDSDDLSSIAPFRLLADGIEGAATHMGQQSLVAVGSTFQGRPGFVLLADRAELEGGGHGEDLQDHDCKIAN